MGSRPWLAIRTSERCVEGLMGSSAVNQEKVAVEGEMTTNLLAWGPRGEHSRGYICTS